MYGYIETPIPPAPVITSSDDYRLKLKRARVFNALLNAGMTKWSLHMSEVDYLPSLIHKDEWIGGVVYGEGDAGSIMIVATNIRLIYIDTKPLFKKTEDISYDAVSGITLEWMIVFGTLILNTRIGDFSVRTTNKQAAHKFKEFVEMRCIESINGRTNG